MTKSLSASVLSCVRLPESHSRLSGAGSNNHLMLLFLIIFVIWSKPAAPGRQLRLDDDQIALRFRPELRETARVPSTLIRAAQGSRMQCLTSISSFFPQHPAFN
ncbi:hypothetical protein B0H17DRAFT_1133110 [Mycena rosella]|uniref:Uncharacterized protein n=1 Tax=Mycena rosella TaxID=1033263 RepID=A0AAD7DJK2_MYCRO|nr:hypothetical protein B0H17DRAFT_1133110 [Mycena rosella]